MSILENLFKSNKVECPRCLGKGKVDIEDIKRLKMKLKWIPGPCAYCAETGKVSSKLESKIPVNMAYLTKDISTEERNMVLKGDSDALSRAEWYDSELNDFITEVDFLYFKGNLNSELITDFFLIGRATDETDRAELLDYITQIISEKTKT